MILQKQCNPIGCKGRLLREIDNLRGEFLKYHSTYGCELSMSYITYQDLLAEFENYRDVSIEYDPLHREYGTVFGLPIKINNLLEPYRFIIAEEDKMQVDTNSLNICYGGRGYGKSFISKLPKKYILNQDTCILFWEDGTKTVVKRSKDDKQDPVKGFLWAYFQKYCGMSKTKANDYLREMDEAYKEAINGK